MLVMSALLVCGAGLFLSWLLGDDFRPWVNTAKIGVKEQISGLVDQYSLELEKSRKAVADAEQRVAAANVQKHKEEAAVTSLRRQVQAAQKEIADAEQARKTLDEKVSDGRTIRLRSRTLSPPELKEMVADFSNRIAIAKEKLGYLEQILTMREARLVKLQELEKQSPAVIRRLRNDVDFLARKLDLYRDVKEWIQEEEANSAQLNGLFETAQRTLESAHGKLDAKLAEVDAILKASVDVLRTEDLLAETEFLTDIQFVLGDQQVILP
jgi:chromosome segregation ATPase